MGYHSSVEIHVRLDLTDGPFLEPFEFFLTNTMKIYLIFEQYEQTKTLFVPRGTKISNLLRLLGINKLYCIQLKEYWIETSNYLFELEK